MSDWEDFQALVGQNASLDALAAQPQDVMPSGSDPLLPSLEGSPGYGALLGGQLSQAGSRFGQAMTDLGQGTLAPTPSGLGAVVNTALGGLQALQAPTAAAGEWAGHQVLQQTGSPVLAGLADVGIGLASGTLAAKGTSALVSKLVARLPGAGVALREAGSAEARLLPEALQKGGSPDPIYQAVRAMNPPVPDLPRLRQQALDSLGRQQVREQIAGDNPKLADMAERLYTNPGPFTFNDVWEWRKTLGEAISKAKGGADERDLKKMFAAMTDDLENMPSSSVAASMLKDANRLFQRQAASEDLSSLIESAISPKEGAAFDSTGFASALKAFRKKVQKDSLFASSFEPGEIKKIEDTLDNLRKLPMASASPSAGAAIMQLGRQTAAGSLAGLLSGGSPYAAGIGAGLGPVVARGISLAVQTDTGRELLWRLASSPRGLSLPNAAIFAGIAQLAPGTQGRKLDDLPAISLGR